MASQASDGMVCHLLALPPELRNRIWLYALPSQSEINPLQARIVSFDEYGNIVAVHADKPYSRQPGPAIMKVNRQVHSETRAISLSTTTFAFDIFTKADLEAFRAWARKLGPDAQYLRNICIDGMRDLGCDVDPERFLISHSINISERLEGKEVIVKARVPVNESDEDCDDKERIEVAEEDAKQLQKALRRVTTIMAKQGPSAKMPVGSICDCIAAFVKKRQYVVLAAVARVRRQRNENGGD